MKGVVEKGRLPSRSASPFLSAECAVILVRRVQGMYFYDHPLDRSQTLCARNGIIHLHFLAGIAAMAMASDLAVVRGLFLLTRNIVE